MPIKGIRIFNETEWGPSKSMADRFVCKKERKNNKDPFISFHTCFLLSPEILMRKNWSWVDKNVPDLLRYLNFFLRKIRIFTNSKDLYCHNLKATKYLIFVYLIS